MTGGHVTPRGLTELVYPTGGEPELDDAAEQYHEASKTCPHTVGREFGGMAALENDPTLRVLVGRAVRRHEHRRTTALPAPSAMRTGLSSLFRARRSARTFSEEAIGLTDLATLLHGGYGVTSTGEPPRRTVPSGGALYPLELYLMVSRVEGLQKGIYHYDPLRHVLEELDLRDLDAQIPGLHVYPELAAAAILLAVTGMFGRSRFKYGLRGYRFTLLEAGHVMQNVLLSATALQLVAIPVGGVYDRVLERLIGVNGVDESIVYCAAVGRAPHVG